MPRTNPKPMMANSDMAAIEDHDEVPWTVPNKTAVANISGRKIRQRIAAMAVLFATTMPSRGVSGTSAELRFGA